MARRDTKDRARPERDIAPRLKSFVTLSTALFAVRSSLVNFPRPASIEGDTVIVSPVGCVPRETSGYSSNELLPIQWRAHAAAFSRCGISEFVLKVVGMSGRTPQRDLPGFARTFGVLLDTQAAGGVRTTPAIAGLLNCLT